MCRWNRGSGALLEAAARNSVGAAPTAVLGGTGVWLPATG
jgi:hypothetical protein